jgi:IMP dehydrogenase/GMP reductase
MSVKQIVFRTPLDNLTVDVQPGWIEQHNNGQTYTVHEGKYVKFHGGMAVVDDTDEESLTALRKSRLYGVSIFEDTQAVAKVVATEAKPADDDRDALLKQIEELKAALQAKERQEEPKSGLARLNVLKKEAKELGIEPENGWKMEDYEKAIAEAKGAQ